jgi:hypothetical protein
LLALAARADTVLELLNAVEKALNSWFGGAGGGDCASTALVVSENKSSRSQREPINFLLTKPGTIPTCG